MILTSSHLGTSSFLPIRTNIIKWIFRKLAISYCELVLAAGNEDQKPGQECRNMGEQKTMMGRPIQVT